MQHQMNQRLEKRVTLDELPVISQKLKLACSRCGQRHTYDVGSIFHDQEGEGEFAKHHYTFTNYFRCRNCHSAGPWEIADHIRMLGLVLRARVDSGYVGFVEGRCALFDGTFIQTPAMGEEHLRALLDQDPHNAFLCTRLGNLLRGCGEPARAIEWYEKALALDAGDIEARYHLYSFADKHLDVPAAVEHGTLLVRYLLQGRQTNKKELTEGIALCLVETLRDWPPEFRAGFLGQPATTPEPRERTFIRTVLEQEGDEDAIVQDAADRLLDGKAEWPSSRVATIETNIAGNGNDPPVDLVPSLKDLIAAQGMNARKLSVAVEADGQRRIRVKDRHSIPLYDGSKLVYWPVPSLRELFRDHRLPPPDMERYPPEYCRHFFFIEEHVLTACGAQGDRTDQELEEIYSMLRRRPDGRSLGPMHDFLWQGAALMLGRHALSQAEHEAIFGQLERSVRKWALRPISRNYVGYLHSILP